MCAVQLWCNNNNASFSLTSMKIFNNRSFDRLTNRFSSKKYIYNIKKMRNEEKNRNSAVMKLSNMFTVNA